MSFGQFVVGGNFVVGIVVFLVLIAIQFIVINHGAVRISEVTARFTLDAMPGRQMAIDADLNAGVIDEQRSARRAASGSAAKPTSTARWTARSASRSATRWPPCSSPASTSSPASSSASSSTASTSATAAQTYTILTVGEGLVTAIPALLVSMSGGLITTRAASESNLGEEVAVQLLARVAAARGGRRRARRPRADSRPAEVVVPPRRRAARRRRLCEPRRRTTPASRRRRRAGAAADAIDAPAPVDPLSIEVGYALVALVDEKQGGTLLNRVRAIRKQIATETGVVVPPVHVADNLQLGPRTLLDSRQGRRSRARRALRRSAAGDQSRHGDGAARRHARRASRRSACRPWWIPQRPARARLGRRLHRRRSDDGAVDAPVGDDPRRSCRICSRRQQTKELVDRVGQTSPKLVEELVPKLVVDRRHPARAAAAAARARAGARPHDDPRGDRRRGRGVEGSRRDHRSRARGDGPRHLPAVSERDGRAAGHHASSPALEEQLLSSIVRTDQGAVLALDPTQAQQLASRIAEVLAGSSGTACALVLTDAATASLAAVHASAAAHRRAVAQRGAAAGADRVRGGAGLTCISKRFRSTNVREALRAAREELGPDALVLSTELVPASRLARLDGRARGRRSPLRREREASAADRAVTDVGATDSATPNPLRRDRRAPGRGRSRPRRWPTKSPPRCRHRARRGASLARAARCARRRGSPTLAASDDDYAARRSVRRPAGRRQDHDDRQDCRAGTRARRPALGAGGGRRLPRSARSSSCAPTPTSSARRFASRAPPTSSTRRCGARHAHAGARRHGRPVAVRRAPRASCSACVGDAPRRAHAPRDAGRHVRVARRAGFSTAIADARPTRLVLTKLDEAESLSPLVSLLRERQLPISYLGTGQRVPEDLRPRDARRLLAASVLGESAAGSRDAVMTQATRPRPARGTIIAITSGKGGVGKTNVVINLAVVAGAARPPGRHPRRRLRPRQHRRDARPHAGVAPRSRADRRARRSTRSRSRDRSASGSFRPAAACAR